MYISGRNNIQIAGVETILDSVMDALKKDSNRRWEKTKFLGHNIN